MSDLDTIFKTKEDFVSFVKNAARRKDEYRKCRRNGASSQELEERGFQTVVFA